MSKPLRVKRPSAFLLVAIPDLFDNSVQFEVTERIFAVMSLCPSHNFRISTSKPARANAFFHYVSDYAKSINESVEVFDDYIRGRNGTVRRSLKSAGWNYAFERDSDDEHFYRFFYNGHRFPSQITFEIKAEAKS